MLRKQVLNLYRNILRSIKEVPDKNSQNELREWAKQDFTDNKNLSEEVCLTFSTLI